MARRRPASSSSIWSRDRPVRRRRRISRMAVVCSTENPKRSMRRWEASASVRLERMMWMTSSMLSRAMR